MPHYRVTWSTHAPDPGPAHACPDGGAGRAPSDGGPGCACTSEVVEADRVDLEAGAWIVLRRTVHVVGRPREVVVRRIAASTVARVEEVPAR